ncbi:hypothetical protein [Streptomyces sp. NPDC088789]|uniref:hypothetical protein n=1 Tax=Streptomyces sp. NPDC088789 TaxID=3365899 RepID=UPI003811E9D7
MNTTTAAATANVTAATIRTWCRNGVVTAVKTAGRWIIDTASLAARIAIGKMKRPARKAILTTETMLAIGGRRWQKNGMDRVYLNDWHEFAGIEVHRYNTGRISYAEIKGHPIANGRAAAVLGAVDKVWFDTADGKLHCRSYGARDFEIRFLDGGHNRLDLVQMLFNGIRAAVAAL